MKYMKTAMSSVLALSMAVFGVGLASSASIESASAASYKNPSSLAKSSSFRSWYKNVHGVGLIENIDNFDTVRLYTSRFGWKHVWYMPVKIQVQAYRYNAKGRLVSKKTKMKNVKRGVATTSFGWGSSYGYNYKVRARAVIKSGNKTAYSKWSAWYGKYNIGQ